jgi:hypothetical protein
LTVLVTDWVTGGTYRLFRRARKNIHSQCNHLGRFGDAARLRPSEVWTATGKPP